MFFSISIETRMDNQEITFKFSGGTDTTFSTISRSALGTIQSLIQYLPGSLSLMLEQSSYATDHPPPASDKVKNMGNSTSTSAYILFSEVIKVLHVRNVKCISTIMCSCNYVIGMVVGDNFLGCLKVSV
jgi:hypothetical protein